MRKKQKKEVYRKLKCKKLDENSIYIGNLYVQTKIRRRAKRAYLLLSSTSVRVTIVEKLLSLSLD